VIHIAKGATIGSIYGLSWIAASATALDEHSLVPIGIAGGIVLFTGGLVWKISGWKTEMDSWKTESNTKLHEITTQIGNMSEMIQRMMRERKYDSDSLRSEISETKLPPNPPVRSSVYTPLVLLIDDDHTDREIMRRNLMTFGFRTVEASSLIEASEILKSHRIDCCLLDLNLSGNGMATYGTDTIIAFVRDYPNALCVALTGDEDPSVKNQALAAGADAFAFKAQTADPGYLPKIVRTAMDRHAMKGTKNL